MPFGRFRTHSPESSASRPDSLHNSTNSTKDGSKAHLPPLRTSTQSTGGSSSSTSDEPTSPRSSTFSTRPLSRLHAAVSRGASTSSASSSSIVPPASEPTNPVQLAEAAISLILTVPGPSIEELRNEYFPKLFHEAYSHRANTREHGLRELENLIKRFRSKFEASSFFLFFLFSFSLPPPRLVSFAEPDAFPLCNEQSMRVRFRSHIVDQDGTA